MADPKIRVSADISGVEQALSRIEQAVRRTQKAISGGSLGVADLQKSFDDIVSSAGALHGLLSKGFDGIDSESIGRVVKSLQEAAAAAKILDQAMTGMGKPGGAERTVAQVKGLADHLNRAVRAQTILAKEGYRLSKEQVKSIKEQFDAWRHSGARGTTKIRNIEFDDWLAGGWRSYSVDERESREHRERILRSIGLQEQKVAQAHELLAQIGGRFRGAIGAAGGVVGSMLGGGTGGMWGTIGSATGTALGSLAGFAFGGPIGATVGLVASGLLGRLGSGVDANVQSIGDESAILTDLRRALGATRVDFDMLRETVRRSTDGIGVSFNEAAAHAREFARAAGDVEGLDSAFRFGRAYGIDPAISARLFGEARQRGVIDSDRDGRRLALHIAEAMQRGGMSQRMDEVIQSLQSYVAQSARASLTVANVDAFLSMFSALGATGLPGLRRDPTAAASMLSSIDAAIRQGGAFGEASRNFVLGAYQRLMPEFSAFDLDVLNEQGAFGTVAHAFGKDSPAYRMAQERGDLATLRRYEQFVAQAGDRTPLEIQMEALEREYGATTDDLRKAIQSHFGISASWASALYEAYRSKGGIGGLVAKLSGAGIDVGRVDIKQAGALAEIAMGDRSVLEREAQRLLKSDSPLTEPERKQLARVLASGSDEDLRNLLLTTISLRDVFEDEGERQREIQADMRNSLQRLATELIPATLSIQEGIVELLRALPFGDKEFVRRYDEQKKLRESQAKAAEERARQINELDRKIETFKPASPEDLSAMQNQLRALEAQRDAAAARGESTEPWDFNIKRLQEAIRSRSPAGVEDLKKQREELKSLSSLSTKDGPRNLRNNNPGNIVYGDFAKRHGAIGSDGRFAIFPDAETGSRAMDALLESYGRRGFDTVAEIINRWAPPSENNTSAYAKTVASRLGVGVNDPLDLSDPTVRAALAREIARFEGDASAYVSPSEARVPKGALAASGMSSQAPITVNVGGELRIVDQYGRPTGQVVPLSRIDAPLPSGFPG